MLDTMINILAAVFFLLMGSGFIFYAKSSKKRIMRIRNEGVKTTAKILEWKEIYSSKNELSYYPIIHFYDVHNTEVTKQLSIRHYPKPKKTEIKIIYLKTETGDYQIIENTKLSRNIYKMYYLFGYLEILLSLYFIFRHFKTL